MKQSTSNTCKVGLRPSVAPPNKFFKISRTKITCYTPCAGGQLRQQLLDWVLRSHGKSNRRSVPNGPAGYSQHGQDRRNVDPARSFLERRKYMLLVPAGRTRRQIFQKADPAHQSSGSTDDADSFFWYMACPHLALVSHPSTSPTHLTRRTKSNNRLPWISKPTVLGRPHSRHRRREPRRPSCSWPFRSHR